ncbi:hypothetical protein [Wolbachia endosymbiont (group A) of Colletes cunicularius]|uniref:hypothetical protein n=1 Tax=Wolbachia endosymbiont (group A) of Colletes cunicularius TaxID=3139321 RepID=UPI0035C8BEDF
MSNLVHSNKNNNRDNFSLRGLQKAVDDMFNSFFMGTNPGLLRRDGSVLPACDLYETEQNYRLSLELPGISKSLSSNSRMS